MARFLFILIVLVVGGMGFLAIYYAKDSYKVLPMADEPENALEIQLDKETDYENWQEFTSPSSTFRVLMPSTPQHVSDKSSDPKTQAIRKHDVYIAEKKNGNVFMIHLIKFHYKNEPKIPEDEVLQGFLDDMLASNPNNKLVASQSAMFNGQRSLDFVIENETFNYDVREFLKGDTLIVLSNISRKNSHNLNDFQFFINSFEFTPSQQNDNK